MMVERRENEDHSPGLRAVLVKARTAFDFVRNTRFGILPETVLPVEQQLIFRTSFNPFLVKQ